MAKTLEIEAGLGVAQETLEAVEHEVPGGVVTGLEYAWVADAENEDLFW